jgi:hypothetical protein
MTAVTTAPSLPATSVRPWGRIVCGAAAVGTLAPFAMSSFSGDSGAEITESLVSQSTLLMTSAFIAVMVAAALFLAAVRLGRVIGGDSGSVVTVAGSAVALMYAAYYGSFGAGAVVGAEMVGDPGPGLGEATSVLVNVTEIARYAPGLALVAAVLVAGGRLPRWVRITAGVLALLTLVPLTSWVAALLIPLWLGATAASLRD